MTTFSLTWLPRVLENAGLKVAEVPGWRGRGRADMPRPLGVMCHHTANPQSGNMPTLGLLINGRSDLQGPLSQLGLGRDGTFYVVAAGRANHAGLGRWEGITTGNASFIGIEAEHSGQSEDEWPPVQKEAYARGVAAILRHIGATEKMCCGHKEYAMPPGRKPDPTFDMEEFRRQVGLFLVGRSPSPPIPALDTKQRPTIRRGSRGDAVKELQTLLGLDSDGIFGPRTEAALRARQRELRLVADGIAGPRTWAMLHGEAPAPEQPQPAGDGASAPASGNGASNRAPRRLGSLSEVYESGRRGPGTVSGGVNDPGGVSYGVYQLASKTGTLAAFMKAEGKPWQPQFGAARPGSSAFTAIWRQIAAREPEVFRAAQHAFIERTHYRRAVAAVLASKDIDLDSRHDAVRDATWSVAVQHGRAANILAEAVAATDQQVRRIDPGYDRQLVEAIYKARTDYVLRVSRNPKLSAGERQQLIDITRKRYPDELAACIRMFG